MLGTVKSMESFLLSVDVFTRREFFSFMRLSSDELSFRVRGCSTNFSYIFLEWCLDDLDGRIRVIVQMMMKI